VLEPTAIVTPPAWAAEPPLEIVTEPLDDVDAEPVDMSTVPLPAPEDEPAEKPPLIPLEL
jgi:hypothetical protein